MNCIINLKFVNFVINKIAKVNIIFHARSGRPVWHFCVVDL